MRLLISGDGVVTERIHSLDDLHAFTTHTSGGRTGVRLSTLLHHAGLLPDAVDVLAVGLDDSRGRVRLVLPIHGGLDDVLVASPARLVVPGRSGITWLRELQVRSMQAGTTGPPVPAWSARSA